MSVYFLFAERARRGVPVVFIIALFTTLASEGAVGLTIIVSNRRTVAGELLKRKFQRPALKFSQTTLTRLFKSPYVNKPIKARTH